MFKQGQIRSGSSQQIGPSSVRSAMFVEKADEMIFLQRSET